MTNIVASEVDIMLSTVWLMLGALLYSLQLNTGSFPRPLSKDEEAHYLTRAKAGDLEARNILVERNLRLVAHIMKKYYTQVSDQEDLISIGTIGLIKGIESFDASKGARLATYAARCVENAILTPMPFKADTPHTSESVKMLFFRKGINKKAANRIIDPVRGCGSLWFE